MGKKDVQFSFGQLESEVPLQSQGLRPYRYWIHCLRCYHSHFTDGKVKAQTGKYPNNSDTAG